MLIDSLNLEYRNTFRNVGKSFKENAPVLWPSPAEDCGLGKGLKEGADWWIDGLHEMAGRNRDWLDPEPMQGGIDIA